MRLGVYDLRTAPIDVAGAMGEGPHPAPTPTPVSFNRHPRIAPTCAWYDIDLSDVPARPSQNS